jgi:tetratricopeptide (TPR) repeat protein
MNDVERPQKELEPLVSRKQALEEFTTILRSDSAERVLNVHGGGGLGKTWFLKDIQRYCREHHGLLYNRQIIDFYDTAHHRVSGLIASIIQELDPEHEFFGSYLELRAEFDRRRALGFGGRALERLGKEMDCAFLTGLQALGAARLQPDGGKGVVLLLDTFEVVRDGRVGRWVLKDLLGPSKDICSGEENPPPIVATQDVAVVIAGRPPIDQERTFAPTRYCSPGDFSPGEVGEYVGEVLGRCGDINLTTDPVKQLAAWITDKTGGHPVQVALALDLANLYIATYGTPAMSGGGLLDVLREIEEQDDRAMALIEQIMDLLGTVPEQQWAVLYMSHLRRRFTRRLCATLMNRKPADMGSLDSAFSAFENLYMAKYRHLRGTFRLPPEEARQFEEATVSLHDLIRDWVHQRYWQGSIPLGFVVQTDGKPKEIFPADLAQKWSQTYDPEGDLGEIQDRIQSELLQSILRWLDDKAVEFYEARRRELESLRAGVDKEREPSRWVEYEYQQHALMAEQLLYEMDRDLEKGWQHWRQVYYEAFESYQQGYCEQLEMTVLSAWPNGELETDPRKREIREMARVRQQWWKIQRSGPAREQAIQELERLLREHAPLPGDEPSELLADVHAALGWAYALEGETRLARQHRGRAAEILRKLRLDWDLAEILDFLGESCDQLGLFRRADEAWGEAIQIAQRRGHRYCLASVAMKWGHSLNLRGESSRALGYAKVAETLFRELEDERSLGLALNYQGRIYQALGKFAHAERALTESQTCCERFESPDDQVRLYISRGEFYRRRAQSEDAQPDDFGLAREALENALRLARAEEFGQWETQAAEELGCLFRDRARLAAQAGREEEAKRLFEQAEPELTQALDKYRGQDAGFKMADLLDDLCQLYADRYRFQREGREVLEEHLAELETVAHERECPLHLARVAERRAELAWEDGNLREAVEHYVAACSYVGLHSRAGETFRTSYDRLVGQLERRLGELPKDKRRVKLTRLALRLWGQTGHMASHPQFAQACRRVLYPAQSRLDEVKADDIFEKGRQEYEAGRLKKARSRFEQAFQLYVRACDQMGRLTDGGFEHYERYMALVGKLERRFYDLPDLRLALPYSEQVQAIWQRLEQAERHPAVLDVCRRVRQMAELVQKLVANSPTG